MTADLWTIAWFVHYAVAVLLIARILRRRRDPRAMMAWILALLLLPFLSLVLYLLIGEVPIQRRVRRRHRRRRHIEAALVRRAAEAVREFDATSLEQMTPLQRGLIQFASRIGEQTVTHGNDVTIFQDATRVFDAIAEAVEAARSHVHFEYYIFKDDDTGRRVADLLKKKAADGVEVRLLLDSIGSWRLSRAFVADLRASGVQVAFFLPWRSALRRLQLNCRNHRKLIVVDGSVGFAGSQNIGDEYANRKRKWGPWRDTHLRLRGPAVAQLQEVFVEDWHFATQMDLTTAKYFKVAPAAGPHVVQIVASGPDRRADVLHQFLFVAVTDAREAVSLITPYFVPDRAMLLALKSAAYRGVRVRLMLPTRSDNWLVLWAGRSFYDELLEAGVEILEYAGGMLHSKVVVVDGRWAMVGSANMDERSFRINFELTTLLYDEGLVAELQDDFDHLRHKARSIRLADVQTWRYRDTLAAGVARLATPLL